jgi:hypothetical protein
MRKEILMEDDLPFINPTAGRGKAQVARATRPVDLAGKVLGLLSNTKEQADIILETVADVLRKRHGVARVVMRHKEGFSMPATDELMDEMAREVQVAVAALGG